MANDEFNSTSCAIVAGTDNIHWENVDDTYDFCKGVELSNMVYDPDTRMATFSGFGSEATEPDNCLGWGTYYLELSNDGLTLVGSPELNSPPMTLTRTSAQDCFVGHWINEQEPNDDWLAHISTDAFPPGAIPAATNSIPTLSLQGIALLITLLVGFTYYNRRRVTV